MAHRFCGCCRGITGVVIMAGQTPYVLPGERIANADKECRDYNPKILNMEEWHG